MSSKDIISGGDEFSLEESQHLATLIKEGASVFTYTSQGETRVVDLQSDMGSAIALARLGYHVEKLLKVVERLSVALDHAEALGDDLVCIAADLDSSK